MPPQAAPDGPLIGRDDSVAAVEARLGSAPVSIVGPPGIGKSRLARHVAAGQPDPILADLTGVRDAASLDAALADAFGAPPMAGATTKTIASMLEARAPTLLVLDDADEARAVVREVLRATPRLTVLVTGRRALDLAGEAVVELGPLSMERDGERASDAGLCLLDAYGRLARRQTAAPPPDEVETLARIAEGVPLALELAAGALATLGDHAARAALPRMLARAVEEGPVARALARAWSALGEDARHVLAALTVLRGPFDLALAAAVVADLSPGEVTDVVLELREGSLVVPSARVPGGLELSPMVRELALARATPDALLAARRRLLGRGGTAGATRDASVLAAAEVLADREPAAVASALAAQRLDARSLSITSRLLTHDLALPLVADLRRQRSWSYFVSGQSGLALDEAQAAMAAAREAGRDDLVAASAINAVSFAIDAGRIELAPAFLEAARERADSPRAELAVKTSEAYLLDQRGQTEEALALLGTLPSPQGEGSLYRLLPATIATMRGYAAAARGDLGPALHLARLATAASSVEGRPLPRYRLIEAIFQHALGEPGAELLMREMIDELLVLEPRWAAAGLGHLAALEATAGRLPRATQTLGRALTLGSTMDSRAIRAALDWSAAVVEVAGDPRSTRRFVAGSPAAWSRVLEALFDPVLSRRRRSSAPPPAPGVLTIDQGGAWIATPDGETVHLGRRHSLRRLLSRIASARATPGAWVTVDEALEAAWPDDRSSRASLKNRLRVAVATLRKMGVGDALEGNRQGYRLDPSLAVEVAAQNKIS